MKHLILYAFVATAFSLGGAYALTSSAHAAEASILSPQAKMLIGEWKQGADRTVGEGEEAAIVSMATEAYHTDGTVDVSYRLFLTSDQLPEDLRTYDFKQVNSWQLEGDQLFTTPVTVEVTYVGENKIGPQIAEAIKNEVEGTLKDSTTLVSINASNYISRMTDGTLISMKRK